MLFICVLKPKVIFLSASPKEKKAVYNFKELTKYVTN